MRISDFEIRLQKHAIRTKSVMRTPFEFNEIIKNMEGKTMSKPKRSIKRTVVIAAVLAICIITVTMTPMANSLKGFFSDIIRFDGAVTGTKYENATNEITAYAKEMVMENGNAVIPLELTFENPNEAPFPYIQEIAVADYIILDSKTGEVLKMECYPEYSGVGTVKDGKVLVNLSTGDTEFRIGEEYTIVIKKMYGLSKADAPFHITGDWECKFVR